MTYNVKTKIAFRDAYINNKPSCEANINYPHIQFTMYDSPSLERIKISLTHIILV